MVQRRPGSPPQGLLNQPPQLTVFRDATGYRWDEGLWPGMKFPCGLKRVDIGVAVVCTVIYLPSSHLSPAPSEATHLALPPALHAVPRRPLNPKTCKKNYFSVLFQPQHPQPNSPTSHDSLRSGRAVSWSQAALPSGPTTSCALAHALASSSSSMRASCC